MAIYRGSGGATDTTDQATIDEVTEQAGAAAASATAAASSASSASTSASNASTSASQAATSATSASTSASQATSSKNAAATSATAAEAAKVEAEAAQAAAENAEANAITYGTNAVSSASEAATSATAAQTARDVTQGYRDDVIAYDSSASDSASAAASSASAAASSATAASDSADEAAASATAAQAALDAMEGVYIGASASVPTADGNGDDLTIGDWYYNTTDNQAYIYNGSTWDALAPDLVGDATPQLGGDLDTNGNDVLFGDNDKAIFGAGSDLQIYYNGTDSVIRQTTDGDILIQTDGADSIKLGDEFGNYLLTVNDNGNVELFHGTTPSKKLETTSTGIAVTGNATFGDNDKAIFGAGSDLQIYHDGSASYIKENGTGALVIDGTELYLRNSLGSSFLTTASGAVRLHNSGYQKLATTSTGIDVTGTATMDGLTSSQLIEASKAASTYGAVAEFNTQKSGVKFRIDDYTNNTSTGRMYLTHNYNRDGGVASADDATIGVAGIEFNNGSILARTDSAGATSPLSRLNIANNGDISFYEDTGTTAKFFWDASAESLGIGTSSPSAKLHLQSSSENADLALLRSGINTARGLDISLTNNSSVNDAYVVYDATLATYGGHIWQQAGVEKARLDASGNLLVGKSSTAAVAGFEARSDGQIVGTRDGNRVAFLNRLTSDGDIVQFAKDGSTVGSIGSNTTAGNPLLDINSQSHMRFVVNGDTSATEAMRLDDSGNLLVGTTDTDVSNNSSSGGVGILPAGHVMAARNGTCLTGNRYGSDGTIIDLRKDGSTVGSIGTDSNSELYISGANNRGGLGFYDSATGAAIQPVNSDGTASNGDTSLGIDTNRFKDLYLSGGVYLGGTGASNHLQDYEEGTWTVSFYDAAAAGVASPTTTTGYYTKIGDTVSISFTVSNIDTTGMNTANRLYIRGLPFSSESGSGGVASGSCDLRSVTFSGVPSPKMDGGSSVIFFLDMQSATSFADLKVSAFQDDAADISISMVYRTA